MGGHLGRGADGVSCVPHKDQPTLLVRASPQPRSAGLSSLKLFSLAGQAG